ncbi:MAG: TolC family protein [Rubrivivax sp.]
MSAQPGCITPAAALRCTAWGRVLLPALCGVLTGCASLAPDAGLGGVQALTQARVGAVPEVLVPVEPTGAPADTARAQAEQALLAQPLQAGGAVAYALLHHPGLQAHLAELGAADAQRATLSRWPNPVLRLGRTSGGAALEWEVALGLDLMALFTLPLQRELALGHFQQQQRVAAVQALAVAAEARAAWVHAVASAEMLAQQQRVMEAAEAATELARRMVQAGHFSALAQLREQAFHADAESQLARARHQALADRERLARALGFAGDPARLPLPERLPALPAAPAPQEGLTAAEQQALEQRLDLQTARADVQATARALGLGRATRFVNVLHAGWTQATQAGEPTHRGVELEFSLPLFDFGDSRVAQAQATYHAALHRAAQAALVARSQVREAHSAQRTAWALARHAQDALVPLRQRIAEESLLRYNGMLGSVFELLNDARAQTLAVANAVAARRDFWLADAALHTATTTGSPDLSATRFSAPTAAAEAAPGGH